MLQPKVYSKLNNKVFDVVEIHFKMGVVVIEYTKNGIDYEVATLNFSDCQFMENTGFKDIHGDYVYVGSILTDEGALGDDYWDYATIEKDINDGYCISWENNEFSESLYECSAYSVVGNIYENKELLKNE